MRIYKSNGAWWVEHAWGMRRFMSWRHAMDAALMAIEWGRWDLIS